jgi:hypothetical protein
METILGPWIYDDETTDKESLNMSDDARNGAINGLINKAKSNRGEQTDDEKQRADAVAFLAGKQPRKQQLRPGVAQLLGRDN